MFVSPSHKLRSPRLGSVHYLNAAPLTFGLEDEMVFTTPARLAELLRCAELDAALVSITEVLLNDRYDIMDGVAIGALGEVSSVLLAHKKPLAEVREVFCDPASLTSVNLLKVLLAERGLKPVFRPLESYAAAAEKDFVLLIGDPAIDFQRAPHTHQIFDLGSAWRALTGQPFVFAVWALSRGVDQTANAQKLRAAKTNGLRQLEQIIRERPEHDEAFRRTYFERHIRYDLEAEEKQAVARFGELLVKHQLGPVFPPNYIL
jgi:predicted solute-binding protein